MKEDEGLQVFCNSDAGMPLFVLARFEVTAYKPDRCRWKWLPCRQSSMATALPPDRQGSYVQAS